MRKSRWLRGAAWTVGGGLCLVAAAVAWLYIDAHRPREAFFQQRKGQLGSVVRIDGAAAGTGQDYLRLRADTGLVVSLRVLRAAASDRVPVLMVLGGHRTGRDAVDLFDTVKDLAIVALDYPYRGPERVRGARQIARALPQARAAFLDTPSAVALAIDWLADQPWADAQRIVVAGVSLGVPFAATAAALDPRIRGVILVHGAADNRLWLQAQVARRVENRWLHAPLGTLLHWLAYGPSFDTAARVATLAPRPVLIVGAREDERTPAGQTELLFAAAGEPRRLRWTDGAHVETDRPEVVDQIMAIAAGELAFVLGDAAPPPRP
jgi:dienelactone hydrolase